MYLQIDEGFVGHPKTKLFAGKLQDPNAAMYLIKLWTWAVRSSPAGDLSEMNPWSIEETVGYRHLDGKCYAAMVACGFVDEAEPGVPTAIHNWAKRTGGDIVKMEHEANRKRLLRAHKNNQCAPDTCPFHRRSEDKPETSGGRPADAPGTATGHPQDDPHQDKSSPVQARPVKEVQRGGAGAHARSNGDADSLLTTPVAPDKRRWPAEEWFVAFKLAWATYRSATYVGQPNDWRSVADLRELLAPMALGEALAAQGRSQTMFAEYLGDRDADVVKARHPWSWFVSRFNGLRFPAEKAQPRRQRTRTEETIEALSDWEPPEAKTA